jgi:hypothetical protein
MKESESDGRRLVSRETTSGEPESDTAILASRIGAPPAPAPQKPGTTLKSNPIG